MGFMMCAAGAYTVHMYRSHHSVYECVEWLYFVFLQKPQFHFGLEVEDLYAYNF